MLVVSWLSCAPTTRGRSQVNFSYQTKSVLDEKFSFSHMEARPRTLERYIADSHNVHILELSIHGTRPFGSELPEQITLFPYCSKADNRR